MELTENEKKVLSYLNNNRGGRAQGVGNNYAYEVTEEIKDKYLIQKLKQRIKGLADEEIAIDKANYTEIFEAIQTIRKSCVKKEG